MADPTLWVIDSYPWPLTDRNKDRPALLRLRPNDSEDNGTSRTQQQQQQQWRQDRMNKSVSPDATNCLRGQRKTSLTSKDPLVSSSYVFMHMLLLCRFVCVRMCARVRLCVC